MDIKDKISKAIRYLVDPDYRFLIAAYARKYDEMPDEEYLRKLFKARMGVPLNLENPKTFNEKLQWLKLNDRKPVYTKMVDKYEAKKYVANIIGEEYIIPTLGVWSRPEDIEWEKLPNEFVLKVTHDSGGLVICKDKSKLNIPETIEKLRKSLERDYYLVQREWPYKDVPRRIIAEKYMTDTGDNLQDYKIHCFNGIPKFVLVCKDRFLDAGLTEDFFNMEWKHLDIKRPTHSNSKEQIQRPTNLEEMVSLAYKLADSIPFVRVDFYSIEGKVYFGELTFFPATGMEKFDPEDWDLELGNWLDIPNSGGYM